MQDTEVVVDKGTVQTVDSYSGFGFTSECGQHKEETILLNELRKEGVTEVYCVGLAFDYCVGSTAEDAAKNGFKTFIVMDATRAVAPASAEAMKKRLDAVGVTEI